jgi:hypothetical protein
MPNIARPTFEIDYLGELKTEFENILGCIVVQRWTMLQRYVA